MYVMNQKHKVISLLIILLILSIPLISFGMDDLEKAYKQKVTLLNLEIKYARNMFLLSMKEEGMYLKYVNRALEIGDIYRSRKFSKQYEKQKNRTFEYKNKLDELTDKKDKLKFKILERYNKLPEWWK